MVHIWTSGGLSVDWKVKDKESWSLLTVDLKGVLIHFRALNDLSEEQGVTECTKYLE